VKYTIQLEYLEDLIDVIISNFNATPHGAHGMTPLEYLQLTCSNSGEWPERADRRDAEPILCERRVVVVRGKLDSGRRPYIHLHGVRYSSDVLRKSYSLLDKKLSILINRRDLRTVQAFFDNGAELGLLRAAPPWDRTPHTLAMRRESLRLKADRKFQHHVDPENCDPIFALIEHLEANALKKKFVSPLYLEARRLLAQHLEEFRSNVVPITEICAEESAKSDTEQSKDIKKERIRLQQHYEPLEPMKTVNG
jgi:hypothetical protein